MYVVCKFQRNFYAPSIGDGVDGVQGSTTFAEASIFADFLLHLLTSSFTVVMELPEMAEYSDWSSLRLSRLFLQYTCNCHQYKGNMAMFMLISKINHACSGDCDESDGDDPRGANSVCECHCNFTRQSHSRYRVFKISNAECFQILSIMSPGVLGFATPQNKQILSTH